MDIGRYAQIPQYYLVDLQNTYLFWPLTSLFWIKAFILGTLEVQVMVSVPYAYTKASCGLGGSCLQPYS